MKTLIAEVAIPISLSLNSSFDYAIPKDIQPEVKIGCRVLIPFRSRRLTGYVVKIKDHSKFEKILKPILRNFDEEPVITDELLRLGFFIQKKYFCSLADSIHAVLPQGVKQAKKDFFANEEEKAPEFSALALNNEEKGFLSKNELENEITLIQLLNENSKWLAYSALIKKCLLEKKSVIYLVPDHGKIYPAIERLCLGMKPLIISSNTKPCESFSAWERAKNTSQSFVMGTRSAIFAPVNNLGLIIMDEEEHFAYRQDQMPHYRAKDLAIERTKIHRSKLVLGSFSPTLETYAEAKKQVGGYIQLGSLQSKPGIKLIDMAQEKRFGMRKNIISGVLEHYIADTLEKNGRLLIFVNKKGFSTFLYCKKCKTTQSCPRCSGSLVYHYKTKTASCPKCSHEAPSPELCPNCKSAYIKYFGYGIEKAESELARLFPSSKIETYQRGHNRPSGHDIMLATQSLFEGPFWEDSVYDTVAVLGCEEMLGAFDFRATERTFARLLRLFSLAKKQLLIQTQVTDNSALLYLQKTDIEGFYAQELKQREELSLPPAICLGIIFVRSADQIKAKNSVQRIFKDLKKGKIAGLDIFEPVACAPFKVRGNYRFQILVKYVTLELIDKKLRKIIENPMHGVIVTFDPSAL